MKKIYPKERIDRQYKTVFDIETIPETGEVVSIVLGYTDVYNIRHIRRFDTLREFMCYYFKIIRKEKDKATKKRLKVLYAHNGNNFDFLLLYQAFDSDEWVLDHCTPIMNDYRLIGMDIKVKDIGVIRLRDSYRILPLSLEKLCENFKPEHGKLSYVDSKTVWKLKTTNPALFWQYAENDVYALQEILLAFQNVLEEELSYSSDLPMTTPALGMRIFRMFMEDTDELWTPNNEKQIEYEKNAYHGGLTLALHTGKFENVKGYDVNSMYPFVMANNEFPDDYLVNWSKDYVPDACGIWKVTYNAPDKKYPPFLFNLEKNEASYNGTAYITSYEMERAKEKGYSIKVDDGFTYVSQSKIFQKYIETCYNIRKRANESGNKALAETMKLLMNSLYGKFAEKSTKTKIYLICEEIIPIMNENPNMRLIGDFVIEMIEAKPLHQFYGIAAHVTAYARGVLHEMMCKLIDSGIKVLYCDTDSVYYQGDVVYENSRELGGVKLEFWGEMQIAGKKLYSLEGNVIKLKAKGIGRAIKQGVLTPNTISSLLAGNKEKLTFETLPSPRDVLFLGEKAAKSKDMTRTIRRMKGVYDE